MVEIDREIAWLRCQLLEAKNNVDARSAELEDPENVKRWREAEGVDAEPEQLEAKERELKRALEAKEVI